MDRLEHLGYQLYLGARNNRKHIPVEMNGAALVFGIREYLSHSFQHTQALISNNEFHAVQAAALEPLKEADPTGLVLFHALGGPQDLPVAVLIYCNCYQNGHIFILSTPVSAQINTIHINIRIFAAL